MKPKFRNVLEMAIEEGARLGYNRAHKHIESPNPDSIVEHITQNIMLCLDEWFDFDDQ